MKRIVKKVKPSSLNHLQKVAGILFVAIIGAIGAYILSTSHAAVPATLTATPSSSSINLGSNVTITIAENSGTATAGACTTDPPTSTSCINAVQADLQYDASKLQYVDVDTTGSDFPTEVQKGASGGIAYNARGVATPASGPTVPLDGQHTVIKVVFKTIGVGTASFSFANSSAIVNAVDNTSVLSSTTGTSVTINDVTAPTAPTGLKTTSVTASSVGLSWTASTDDVGVVGYDIYRSTGGGSASKIGSSATTSYTDTDPNLSGSTTYSYTIKARDAASNTSAGSTALSVTTAAAPVVDTTPPTVPSNVKATKVYAKSVTLTWTSSTDNVAVAGYNIYRNGTKVGSSTTPTYTDTGLIVGTPYTYTIEAYDTASPINISAKSTTLTVTTAYRPGDVTGDDQIDISDFAIMANNWHKSGATRAMGDLDGSGTVDIADFSQLASNWHK